MAIFGKKCAICGKSSGLLSRKIANKDKICDKCWSAVFGSFPAGKVTWKESANSESMTVELYQQLLEEREENREKLEDFSITKKLNDCILLDEENDYIVFYPYTRNVNRQKLLEDNPHVFDASDLAMIEVILGDTKEGETLTGKGKAERTQTLVLGFDEPFLRLFTIKLPNQVVTSGFLGEKVQGVAEGTEVYTALSEMKRGFLGVMDDNDEPVPASSLDAFWRLTSEALHLDILSQKEIKESLKVMYGKDRAAIKEIKQTYNL